MLMIIDYSKIFLHDTETPVYVISSTICWCRKKL